MTAEKRHTNHLLALQASQIAYGHLKASSEGLDPTSIRSAATYLTKALDACNVLAKEHDNPIDPNNMTKANEKLQDVEPARGS